MEMRKVMLIVDDVEINRAILTQFFKNDYVIVEAENGKAALDVMEHQSVDIVLLDLVMPVMDGFELLSILIPYSIIIAIRPSSLLQKGHRFIGVIRESFEVLI